jgi:conjugal transfer pilus assembly protein TraW
MLLTANAQARDYGQHGALWPVIEPDLLAQIHKKLLALEASGEIAQQNEALKRQTITRVRRPAAVAGIVPALRARRWVFDPTITVRDDIRDDQGRTIMAAGTHVNPLDTVPLRAPLVFLDGDDAAQLDWALARFGPTQAKFILTKGAPLDLMKARQRRFYFDQGGKLVAHFAIRAVPAVVEQSGRQLVITEHPPVRVQRRPL